MSRTLQIVIVILAAFVLLALCSVAGTLIYRSASQPASGAETGWERVQSAGKIIVGTSADYPPFAYYVDESRIDGFDVALMDAIGRELGVAVEYRNLAFDGLFNALQVNQIDAAIAAISITPERESMVDFTNVYYAGEDGILANAQSAINSISSPAEMANRRVGVQRGTVFEEWAQTNLVDAGLIPAANLLAYDRIEPAVRDLRVERLDLVILDLQPAEAYAREGGVKLVGRGLNPQRLAIALPRGSASLRQQIDRALSRLYNSGAIASLASQYLNLGAADLLPTPTPRPGATSTPGPLPPCVDSLAFVQHLNYDFGGNQATPQMQPGQPFSKGWRVKNSGTCTWDANYTLVYVHGNNAASDMSGQPVPITRLVEPGETLDIYVDLIAPSQPGSYSGFWQMENRGPNPTGQPRAFGERLPVAIQVVGAATVTPAPTQTPSPGISFSVDRTQIRQGECVTFSWKVVNVRAVYLYADGERWQDNGVPGEGRQQECPSTTTTYYLRVVKLDNTVEERQITIYVESVPDAPVIRRFNVEPAGQITLGACVNVLWEAAGNVTRVTITANNADLWDGAPVRGSLQNCPPGTGQVVYGIQAVGPGGSTTRQQTINVVAPATATPEPTRAPDPPVINSFQVNPAQIELGQCTEIAWSTSGGTSWVTILRGDTVLQDNAPLSGTWQDCPPDAGSVLYGILAYNPVDQTARQQQTVTVTEPEPVDPLAGTSWAATNYYNAATNRMESVLPGTGLTATFSRDGRVSGSAGCNDYQGGYSVDGQSLSILGPSATGRACTEPEGIMEQESAFLNALGSAAAFDLEAGQLYILNGANQAVIEFLRRDR